MKTNFIFYLLILTACQIFGQVNVDSSTLKIIEIRKAKFYQDGMRLKSGKPLELALRKANNDIVNALYRKGKNIQTAGIVVQCLGLGLMAAGIFSAGTDGVGSKTIAGAALSLTGIIISIPGAKSKKKAVLKYNEYVKGLQ